MLAFSHLVFILYNDPVHHVVCVDLKHERRYRCKALPGEFSWILRFQAARASDNDLYIAIQPVEDDKWSGINKLSLFDLVMQDYRRDSLQRVIEFVHKF